MRALTRGIALAAGLVVCAHPVAPASASAGSTTAAPAGAWSAATHATSTPAGHRGSPRTDTALPGALLPAADGTQECTPGSTAYVDQTPSVISQLGIGDAWTLSRGNVLVAIVDSGVDAGNAHLADAVVAGTDLVDGGDGRTDISGHGTAVAGQIAAREVAGSGVVGVAPSSQILPVRVYADTSEQAVREGRGPDAARTAAGITWAADNGAVIIVVPQSTPSDVPELRAAVDHATLAGALVVASAGNASEDEEGSSVRFPAGYPQALSVTAVDAQGHPSDAVVHGVHVEIAAPGSQVLTTFLSAGDCLLAPETPTSSYATGYVAGAAALVAASHPGEEPVDWEYRLLATALRPTAGERDPLVGWGVVAPYDAMNMINDGSMAGPPNPRHAPTAEEVPPVMARPTPTGDPLPARRAAIALVAAAGVTTLLVVLLVGKLRVRGRRG